jgi:sugar (pentulose or hexulose) kinase
VTDLLVGIDVGTSACKAAVVDADGRELSHGKARTPWRQVPTGAEVDPEALFAAAVEAAKAAVAAAPEGRVRGIGVTSMAEAGVLLDAEDRVLHPAIAWHDARGADEAERIAAELGAERFSERTGLPASPLCTLAKLRWLVDHHPPARAGRRWLNVGEWVVRRLGGNDVAELSLSSRTGMLELAKEPFADALAWAELPNDLLPEFVLAGTPAGAADGAALPEARGAALTVAGHDHLCAGAGVGVVAPGDVLDSCGTAEALVRVVAPPLEPDEVRRSVVAGVTVGFHLSESRQALLAGVWSGIALREVLTLLGVGSAGRAKLAAGALATAPGELPALGLELHSLERPPLRLPDGVPPERIWRAAVDAVAAEVDSLLRATEEIAGPHRRIVVTGGWARDAAVRASKARLGAVEAPPVVEAGARGAALLAGVAAGLFASVDDLPSVPSAATAGRGLRAAPRRTLS